MDMFHNSKVKIKMESVDKIVEKIVKKCNKVEKIF